MKYTLVLFLMLVHSVALPQGAPGPSADTQSVLQPLHAQGDESLLWLMHLSRSPLAEITEGEAPDCHPPEETLIGDPEMSSESIPAWGWRTVQELAIGDGVESEVVARLQYFDRRLQKGNIPLKAYLVTIFNSSKYFSVPSLSAESPKTVETLSEMASRNQSLVAINGGYFSRSKSLSFVANQGEVLSLPDSIIARTYVDAEGLPAHNEFHAARAVFGTNQDGQFDMSWMYPVLAQDRTSVIELLALNQPLPNIMGDLSVPIDEYLSPISRPWDFDSGIGGGPMLLFDGELKITLAEELFWGGGDINPWKRQPRTGIAFKGDTLYMMVVDGRALGKSCGLNLKEMALTFQSLGADYAMNLDGGGSTSLWLSKDWLIGEGRLPSPGFTLNRPSDNGQERAIGSGLAIQRKR